MAVAPRAAGRGGGGGRSGVSPLHRAFARARCSLAGVDRRFPTRGARAASSSQILNLDRLFRVEQSQRAVVVHQPLQAAGTIILV